VAEIQASREIPFTLSRAEVEGSFLMSSYQIHYLNKDRALACLMQALCFNDTEAREYAQSFPGIRYASLEIWRGETKIFEALHPRTLN
jgi:hypothetical protein